MEIKDALIPIGNAVLQRIRAYAAGSPFVISSVVVGNIPVGPMGVPLTGTLASGDPRLRD